MFILGGFEVSQTRRKTRMKYELERKVFPHTHYMLTTLTYKVIYDRIHQRVISLNQTRGRGRGGGGRDERDRLGVKGGVRGGVCKRCTKEKRKTTEVTGRRKEKQKIRGVGRMWSNCEEREGKERDCRTCRVSRVMRQTRASDVWGVYSLRLTL